MIRKPVIIVASVVALATPALTTAAQAGCPINVEMKNRTHQEIQISVIKSKVRVGNLAWRKIFRGGIQMSKNISPDATHNYVFNASMGCNKKRSYRILYRCQSSGQWHVARKNNIRGGNVRIVASKCFAS